MKKNNSLKIAFALGSIVSGLILNYFKVGSPDFRIFGSVGNWLIYIGFVSLIITIIRLITKPKEKKVDERMEYLALKSQRLTFLVMILTAFAVIVIDGIKAISIPYHLFMSYFVCWILIVSLASYKLLLRLG